MTDREKIDIQERKDFNITNKIMTTIFQAYDARISMTQTKTYYPVDANMVVEKGKKRKKYKIEIKERNIDCMEELETLPLKVKKYCNIMETINEDETPLIIYLVNNEQYFIFNLKKLDMNNIVIRNWNIPKVQYTTKHQYEQQPTFFIPINQCIYNGIIPHNAYN